MLRRRCQRRRISFPCITFARRMNDWTSDIVKFRPKYLDNDIRMLQTCRKMFHWVESMRKLFLPRLAICSYRHLFMMDKVKPYNHEISRRKKRKRMQSAGAKIKSKDWRLKCRPAEIAISDRRCCNSGNSLMLPRAEKPDRRFANEFGGPSFRGMLHAEFSHFEGTANSFNKNFMI